MGKDAARDAAGAITAAGVAAIAAGSVPNPASPALLPGGIAACIAQAGILGALAAWDAFAAVVPDPAIETFAMAQPFGFPPLVGSTPVATVASEMLAAVATMVSDGRAAHGELAKWSAASNNAALRSAHAEAATGWLARVDADKLIVGSLCSALSTLLADGAPQQIAKPQVLGQRADFLAGKIPVQEQHAFEIMRITPAERQAILQEVELTTGASLPAAFTLGQAFGLVGPAFKQVRLQDLVPRGFVYSPPGC